MADQLNLSYWLRGFSEENMLRKFERLLRTFPFSTAATTVTTLRIYAMEFAEPPLLEVSFASPTGPEEIVETAAQFQNADCAFLVGGAWDLWQRDSGWLLSPSKGVSCGLNPARISPKHCARRSPPRASEVRLVL